MLDCKVVCCECSSSWVHLGSMNGLSACPHVFWQIRAISPLPCLWPTTNILFVCLTDIQWSNNETEAYTVFHTTCCAGVLYPSVSLTRCTNLFSMVSQYSAYSAGAERYSGNKLEQAEWTKGKMQQAGSGHGASPCSGSPAAVWLLLADASFCPAGQKEKCWEAMDSWWETWNFAKSYPVVGFTRGLDHFVSRKIS